MSKGETSEEARRAKDHERVAMGGNEIIERIREMN